MDTRPSFFKVLIFHHFHTHLRLPPHFSQRYGSDLPHKVKLRVCSGRTWGVEVGPLEDGMFGFKSGWKEFAEEIGLKFGEFVVFNFDGKSIFDVSAYGKTACKREIHLHHHTNRDTNSATNSTKRTRGRSPEILIEVPVKRARGTPSKPRIVPPTGAKGGTSKPKRGRGRPPKRKSSNGRGRPPKSSNCKNIQGSSNLDAGVPNRCSVCEITKTPMWRTGPNGSRTLCNACGLKFRLGRLETSASPVRSEIGKWSYVELEKENEQLLKENKEMASRLKSVEEHWSNQKGDLKARVEALVKDQLRCHYFNGLSQKG